MKLYKPEYIGKIVSPATDQAKLTDFLQNKYNAFTRIYNICKSESENISDIGIVEKPNDENNSTLHILISTDMLTLDRISRNINNDELVKMNGNTIMAFD